MTRALEQDRTLFELCASRLVGKLDAKADRKAGILIINALHEDVRFNGTMRAAVEAEIEALAA